MAVWSTSKCGGAAAENFCFCCHILRLIQKYLTVQRRQLGRGVHVEHQHPAGGHKQVQPPECPLYVLWVRQVVETVQTAHRRVHRAVQVQPRHGLVQENNPK